MGPASQCPAELSGVQFDTLAPLPLPPPAAGRPGEGEVERLAVKAGPLGDGARSHAC